MYIYIYVFWGSGMKIGNKNTICYAQNKRQPWDTRHSCPPETASETKIHPRSVAAVDWPPRQGMGWSDKRSTTWNQQGGFMVNSYSNKIPTSSNQKPQPEFHCFLCHTWKRTWQRDELYCFAVLWRSSSTHPRSIRKVWKITSSNRPRALIKGFLTPWILLLPPVMLTTRASRTMYKNSSLIRTNN